MLPDKLNRKKTPIVKIDKKLDHLKDTVLFPKKLKQANTILKNVGLPKLEEK
jgi:hypothetical protein